MADRKGPIFLHIVPDCFLVSFLRQHNKNRHEKSFDSYTQSCNSALFIPQACNQIGIEFPTGGKSNWEIQVVEKRKRHSNMLWQKLWVALQYLFLPFFHNNMTINFYKDTYLKKDLIFSFLSVVVWLRFVQTDVSRVISKLLGVSFKKQLACALYSHHFLPFWRLKCGCNDWN